MLYCWHVDVYEQGLLARRKAQIRDVVNTKHNEQHYQKVQRVASFILVPRIEHNAYRRTCGSEITIK